MTEEQKAGSKLLAEFDPIWGKWECPICKCVQEDPSDIWETTCRNGHNVELSAISKDGFRSADTPDWDKSVKPKDKV